MSDRQHFNPTRIVPPEIWLLFRHKWLIAACVLAMMALGAAYLVLRPDHYTSTADLVIDNRRMVVFGNDDVLTESQLTDGIIDSQAEVLTSDSVGLLVVDELALAEDPEFAPEGLPLRARIYAALGLRDAELTPEGQRRTALRNFKENLTVQRVGMSYVLHLSFRSEDPVKAATILQVLIDNYLRQRAEINAAAGEQATGWLRSRARNMGITASVATRPAPPSYPGGLGAPAVLVACAVLGLLLGLGAALFRSLFNTKLVTPADVEDRLGVPCFGALPPMPRGLPMAQDPTAAMTLQLAAGDLLGQAGGERARVIGICAVERGVGASTVARELAALISQAAGEPVLLVDASQDSAAAGIAPLKGAPDVTVLTVWPAEKMASMTYWMNVAPRELADWHRDRGTIVIDLPPASTFPDTRNALPLLDALIGVVGRRGGAAEAWRSLLALPEVREKLRGVIYNRLSSGWFGGGDGGRGRGATVPAAPPAEERPPVPVRAAAERIAAGVTMGLTVGPSSGLAGGGVILARFVVLGLLGALMLMPAGARAAEYRIVERDKLEVVVPEFPQSSGIFAVDADGTIVVPEVGYVQATGLTPREVAARVGDQMSLITGGGPDGAVTVRIAEYAPVYVMGDVEVPGGYPFVPGMTPLQAVALAGGVYRTGPDQMRAVLNDAGEMHQLLYDRARTLAQMARLRAEVAGADAITWPERDLRGVDPTALAEMIAQETAIFEARRDLDSRQIEGLARLRELYTNEIATLGEQMELKRRQIETYAIELERLSRSTTPSPRALELQRSQADAESQLLELVGLRQRAEQLKAQAEQDALMVDGGQYSDATNSLRDRAAALEQIDERLAALRELTRFARVPIFSDSWRSQGLRYRVSRRGSAEPIEVDASGSVEIMPGDIIEVLQTTEVPNLN